MKKWEFKNEFKILWQLNRLNASWKKKSYLILEGFDKIIYVYTVKGKKKKKGKKKERKNTHLTLKVVDWKEILTITHKQ